MTTTMDTAVGSHPLLPKLRVNTLLARKVTQVLLQGLQLGEE